VLFQAVSTKTVESRWGVFMASSDPLIGGEGSKYVSK